MIWVIYFVPMISGFKYLVAGSLSFLIFINLCKNYFVCFQLKFMYYILTPKVNIFKSNKTF